MIEHSFCIVLDPSSLVDSLLILKEIDDNLALVSVVPKDKISAQREVTYQLSPAFLILHVYFASPYSSCTLSCEYLRNSWVNLPEVFNHHVLPLFLSDFWWHLQSDSEKRLEGVGLFGVVKQLASQFRRRFEQIQAELFEDFESFCSGWIFKVSLDLRLILMMQESLDLHVLNPSLADLSHKVSQALLKPLPFLLTQLHTFYLVEVQHFNRAYKLSVLLFHLLQSDCYLTQFLHQLMICCLPLSLHVELDNRLYFLLTFKSQQKPTEAVLLTNFIYFPQHLLLYSIQYVSLKGSIAILKDLQIQIQLSLDDLVFEDALLYESFRFFLRFELQKELIIAFIEPLNRIHNLRDRQILCHHLHIDRLLYIAKHDCPYFLFRLHLTYILIINEGQYIMDRQLPMKLGNQKMKHHSYSMLGKVGNGNFGEAFLVESALDGRKYIMKRISIENKSTQSKEQILKEIKLMQHLNHCYVVKYRESFVKGKFVCIVMEYAEKGDLEKELETRRNEGRPLSQAQVIEWFIQLALGMKYIHEKKILHRDLKADNIFITSGNQMKIGDFGISKLMSQTFDLAKTKIGTPFVMAPEIWEDRRYNQKSDIWSLGCVLHKMLTLRYPFQAENSGALLCKLMARKLLIIHGNYSSQLKGLVLSMLDFQPQRRPSVHKILEMPFIKKHLCQTLQKTINLYDENMASNDLKRSSSANRLLRKRDSASLSSSLLPARQSSQEYLKIVQYKQNYPVIQQENRCLKEQLQKQRIQRQEFEEATQSLLRKLRQSTMDKDQVLGQVQQHILNYLYP